MNAHAFRSLLRRRNFVTLTALFSLSLVVAFGFAVSGARPQNDSVAASAKDGREFKVKIPEHLPIKVKVKNEKSFKDLQNKRWLREFELEVKNTGSKPIYYVQLLFGLPDVYVGGPLLSFNASYGRRELFFPETAVEPGDVPIMPGESVTLKANEQNVKGYEYHRDVLGEHGDPKRVVCEVTAITFGDGTGLWGHDGKIPLPKRSSSNAPKQKNGAEGCRSSPALGAMNAPSGLFKVSNSWQPASLLRAYFLPPVDAPALTAAPDDCGCHSVSGCLWGNYGFRNCPSCTEPEMAVVFAGGCGNSGRCLSYVTRTINCPAESDPTLKCTWDDPTGSTCFLTDPTPTPEESPSPSPDPNASPSPTPPPCTSPKPADCCECGPPPPGTVGLPGSWLCSASCPEWTPVGGGCYTT